jgi:membrane-bound lytic murein transglycosylase B
VRLSSSVISPLQLAVLIALSLGLATSSTSRADVSQKSFGALLSLLKKQALAGGIPQETLDSALEGLQPVSQVIDCDHNQPEAGLTFDQYLGRILSEERIARGRKKLTDSRRLLAEIAEAYGVQPRFLVALWGMETDFGRVTGSFPVIDSFTPCAYWMRVTFPLPA